MKWFVHSLAGGVGKSTLAVALALAAAESGKDTILLDASGSGRAADEMLGVHEVDVLDLTDVAAGEAEAGAVCYRPQKLPNLRYALVSHEDPAFIEDYDREIRMLEQDCGLLIIDVPAFDRGIRRTPFAEEDRVLLVARADRWSYRGLSSLCGELEQGAAEVIILINDTAGGGRDKRGAGGEEPWNLPGEKPPVFIERDTSLPAAAYDRHSLMRTSVGAAARKLAASLLHS